MARKVRVFFKDMPVHIFLKGIDGLTIFKDTEDFQTFLYLIKELLQKVDVSLHSYILQPTSFEFLATPKDEKALPSFLQSLRRNYVVYFNKKYSRSGTIWDGRYKSSLVEESYLFDVMKYIEMQFNEKDFNYCSINKNLFNKKDDIVNPHNLYKSLGFKDETRIKEYKRIFDRGLTKEQKTFIENSLQKQTITGSYNFIKRLEKLLGMTLLAKKRGRPKKQKDKKMYKNLVVLDKTKHKELKINPMEDLEFAKETAFIPTAVAEVKELSKSFPVVFTADEIPSIITLVSLGGSSLAINNDGKWITNYVPMFLRRYPYSLATTQEEDKEPQKVVLIDEDSPLFSKTKGTALFNEDGEQSDALKHAINFLTQYDQAQELTKAIVKTISDAGILEDREIAVGEGDEKKVLIKGFKVVDREKLNKLSDDVLADWYRRGILSFIDMHLNSLENIQVLFNLAAQRQQ